MSLKKTLTSKNAIIIIAIFVIITILYMNGTLESTGFDTSDTGLIFTGVEDTKVSVEYMDITSIDYDAAPDYGNPVDGGIKNGNMYGTWENEDWGKYEAFLTEKIEGCVIIRTEDVTLAYNCESTETTKNFYEAYSEYIQEIQGQE